ncbi:MAG TPA: helix-turn-helix domain-containing protein [Aestuariivirgaceae bacterium]|nr:helix-turn-helix domain-containing protein [Aestuariivirgaceae bacterium]
MKPRHHKVTEECQSVSEILSRVGDKWSVLVVSLLGSGPMRFSELRRSVDGISQKMLTTTLRNLERDGFCTRTVFATVPPRVDYELTALGRDLLVPVKALGDWAVANRERIDAARRRFDDRNGTRAPASAIQPRGIDQHTP